MPALWPRLEIIAVLRQLVEAKTPIGLLSNASPEVPRLWPSYALAPYFEAPVFSCLVGMMKPEEGIYRLACDRLGLPPEACLFLGDGGDDELLGARSAGMTPVQDRASAGSGGAVEDRVSRGAPGAAPVHFGVMDQEPMPPPLYEERSVQR